MESKENPTPSQEQIDSVREEFRRLNRRQIQKVMISDGNWDQNNQDDLDIAPTKPADMMMEHYRQIAREVLEEKPE